MSLPKKLTICIVHYRRLPQLKKAVRCLKDNTFNDFNLKILNNGYLDNDIKEYLDSLCEDENIEVVYSADNLGPGGGRNVLISDIKTPFVVTMDDDVYMTTQGWDVPLIDIMERDSDVGAVGLPLYDQDGRFMCLGANKVNIAKRVIKFSPYMILPDDYSDDFLEVDSLSCVIVYRHEINDHIKVDSMCQINDDWERSVALKRMGRRCLVYMRGKAVHERASVNRDFANYNKSRRDYRKIRQDYLLLVEKSGLRLDILRHCFYKYVCLLPNNITRELAYRWLNK
jgi:GT2 family glycosyltransferase